MIDDRNFSKEFCLTFEDEEKNKKYLDHFRKKHFLQNVDDFMNKYIAIRDHSFLSSFVEKFGINTFGIETKI